MTITALYKSTYLLIYLLIYLLTYKTSLTVTSGAGDRKSMVVLAPKLCGTAPQGDMASDKSLIDGLGQSPQQGPGADPLVEVTGTKPSQ